MEAYAAPVSKPSGPGLVALNVRVSVGYDTTLWVMRSHSG